MLWLETKKLTHYNNIEALKMFEHYKLIMDSIDSDENYYSVIRLVNEDGELIKEYYRDEE